MNKNLILLLFLIPLCLGAKKNSSLTNRVNQRIIENDISSMSLTVNRSGKVIYKKGFGLADVDINLQTNLNVPYCIASITKSFKAITIMMLNEEVKINLNESINE